MEEKPIDPRNWTEEEKKSWVMRHLTGPCIGCKAVEQAFRKLFFTKTS